LTFGMLSREEALRRLKAQQIEHLAERGMSVAIFQQSAEQDQGPIDRSILEGIEHIVRQFYNDAFIIRMDDQRQAILLFHELTDSPAPNLQKIIEIVHQKDQVRLTVSAGVPVPSVLDAVVSYHTAIRILEQLSPF